MSTVKSSTDHLTLNADGASKDIKFQANGVEKASISSTGAFTSTSIDATKLSGNLPAIDGSALTNLPAAGVRLIRSIQGSEFNASITASGTHSSHSAWANIGGLTFTPYSASSQFLIDWSCGFTMNNERTGIDFGLFINGSRVVDALGEPSNSQQYLMHRVTVNGSGYFKDGGKMLYSATSTAAVTIGIGYRIYDENLGYSVNIAHTSFPLRLIITEVSA
jgi:hypothetical protein